jgi:hypothetical protein
MRFRAVKAGIGAAERKDPDILGIGGGLGKLMAMERSALEMETDGSVVNRWIPMATWL